MSLYKMDWESHLVVRAQQGESVAFELLTDLYREPLRALAYRNLRNADDAQDVVQDTFVKAFRAIHQFRTGRPVFPWLARICANCCIDVMRQRRHKEEELEKHEFSLCGLDNVERSAEASEDRGMVRASIMKLPKHYREIVMMRHYDEMEVSEIAQRINKPEGTVKSWLFRARAIMRQDLEPMLQAS